MKRDYNEVVSDMFWDDEVGTWYKSIVVRRIAMVISIVAIVLSILSMLR